MGRYAIPIAFFRNGVWVPLVTKYLQGRPCQYCRSRRTRHSRGGAMPRVGAISNRQSPRHAPAFCFRNTSAPTKSSFSTRRSSSGPPRAPSSCRRFAAVKAHCRLQGAACRARQTAGNEIHAFVPDSITACHTRSADEGGTRISKTVSRYIPSRDRGRTLATPRAQRIVLNPRRFTPVRGCSTSSARALTASSA